VGSRSGGWLATLCRLCRLYSLTRVAREVRRDLDAARERDPSAAGVGSLELLATWPGVQALLAHRIASALHGAGVPVLLA